MALAIPLLDVCLSITRRWLLASRSLTDRGHIHRQLLARGSHRQAYCPLYAVCGF
jgi:hypothetical protein